MVRWGILGTAAIAKTQLIPAFRQAKNAELTAVASRSEDKARDYAADNGISKYYGTYEALLADKDIDAVYIPLPNHLHAKWSIEASKQGKHVLCEKPAALTEAETKEIIESSEANSVVWMEAFMYQFHPQWQRVLQLLQTGEIGDVKLVTANFSFLFDRPDDVRWNALMGGGALYDVGCYTVHACRTLAGKTLPEHVHAVAQMADNGAVDTTTSALLQFPNGIHAFLNSSFALPDRQDVEIVGTHGTMALSHAFRPDLGEPILTITTAAGKRIEEMAQVNTYTLQVEHFGECIETGRKPYNSPLDSLHNMQILDRIHLASGRVL